ncbi:unnamed protein product, partial [Mesorhabditis spiculigera]
MDGMIELIVKRMRTDDLLVVLGDHGMTSSGDHGGDTTPRSDCRASDPFAITEIDPPLTAVPRQIDLVPSLALLLGVPIPFSNLGIVIPQLFPKRQDLSQAVQLNYEQVIRDEPNSFSQLVIRSGVLLLQMGLYNGGSDSISVPPLLATLVILTLFHLGKMAAFNATLVIVQCLAFFSNSFVNREAELLRYLLQSAVFVSLIVRMRGWEKKLGGSRLKLKSLTPLLFSEEFLGPISTLFLLRFEPLFHRCREEETDCVQYFPTTLAASLPNDIRALRLIFGVAASLAFLSVYFHWGLDLVSHDSDNIKLALLSTAWLIYAIAALVLVLNFRPNSEQSCAQQRWNIFHGLLPILYLLLGEGMAIGLTIFIMISLRIHSVVNAEFKTGAETTLLGLGFYFLGHSPTLTAIPWTAAFIGPCSCSPTFSPQPSYFAARCYYSLLSTSSR